MKKVLLLLLLSAMITLIFPHTANACDKVIKNPKSTKNAKHSQGVHPGQTHGVNK